MRTAESNIRQMRWIKRETKAQQYRAVALTGGGKREVARRAGRLHVGQQLNTLANLVPVIRDQLEIISQELANLKLQVSV